MVVTLLVLGLLLAPLAVLTVWLRNTLLDTDHYVTTMAPLAASPAVQDAVTNAATSAIFAQVDVAQLAREGLPPRAQFLAEPLVGQVQSFTRGTIHKVVASDQFQNIWVQANREAHRQVTRSCSARAVAALLLVFWDQRSIRVVLGLTIAVLLAFAIIELVGRAPRGAPPAQEEAGAGVGAEVEAAGAAGVVGVVGASTAPTTPVPPVSPAPPLPRPRPDPDDD